MDIAKKCIRTHDIFFLRHSHFLQYQKSQPTANYVKINKAINFATSMKITETILSGPADWEIYLVPLKVPRTWLSALQYKWWF